MQTFFKGNYVKSFSLGVLQEFKLSVQTHRHKVDML